MRPDEVDPRIHLFRGAPAVRSWSKYRQTVRDWTLCGISGTGIKAVENPASVTCLCCLAVLQPATPRKTRFLPRNRPQVASARLQVSGGLASTTTTEKYIRVKGVL
jgi:hypothetical protein